MVRLIGNIPVIQNISKLTRTLEHLYSVLPRIWFMEEETVLTFNHIEPFDTKGCNHFKRQFKWLSNPQSCNVWLRALNEEQCPVTWSLKKIITICYFDDADNLLIPQKHWQHFLAWKKTAVQDKLSGLWPKRNKQITAYPLCRRPIQLQVGLSIGAKGSSHPLSQVEVCGELTSFW